MPGVDFVINPLLETSGLRCDGDCASATAQAIRHRTETSTRGLLRRMRPSVIAAGETQSANAVQPGSFIPASFDPPRRFRAAIAPSNVAVQPFSSRDARRLLLASPPDVL